MTSHLAPPTPPQEPVIGPDQSYRSVTDRIVGIPLAPPGLGWIGFFGLALALTMVLSLSIAWVIMWGVGIWGVNIPAGWGFAIVNFVWWIGIGHAGTLISAILLLLRQEWRTSINRFAEAMTLFAVANAGLFPLLHLGRITRFYYLLPYPNTMGMWPQWRSPLVWDVFAVLTYATVSLLFWYVGLVPDLATMRDTARQRWARVATGILALGWRGSARHWDRYQMMYLLLAGLATPLVVSVHSIVSLDFSVGIVPGWHSTIFPPYFVAGAIYGGFAMVITIAVPLRAIFNLRDFITARHLDCMAKVMLVSGLIVAYGYLMENFTAWFSAEPAEVQGVYNRMFGPYGWIFWGTIFCNVVVAQALWFYRVRTGPVLLFIVAQFISVGMWGERFTIIITSLTYDYVPSSWGMYYPTIWDITLFLGTLGFFTLLMLLFIRLLPSISIFEVRELIHAKGLTHHSPPPADTDEERRLADAAHAAARDLPDSKIHGIAAEFETPEAVIDAARRAHDAGYRRVEAYTPYPVDGLPQAMRLGPTRIPPIVLAGAIVGGAGAYFMQWYAAVIDYPWNIGGRPYHSWPSFVPLTFEMAILFGAIFGLIGLLMLNRLPQPYHPMFNAPAFERASRDRFFLCIEKDDPSFDRGRVNEFFENLRPLRVSAVPT